MILVLLGPPGAGKGTYASRLSQLLSIPHISTGDLVRDEIKADSELGRIIKNYSDKGLLVPDEIITDVLKQRISKPDCDGGFILDGFPRTLRQAELLDEIAPVTAVINIDVPDEVIIERLSNRLICRNCGAIYNAKYLKPKRDMICDECGGPLYRRMDDDPEVIKKRLEVYRSETAPLIHYYEGRGLLRNFRYKNPRAPPELAVNELLKLVEGSLRR
ncbi:adenylate kinase [Candidatus Bathyarchaeota archaeon]|nr:adenylate kinase [Candidatus Bathyarchaeota archaeon]